MNIALLPDLAQIALFWTLVMGFGFGLAWLVNRLMVPTRAKADMAPQAESPGAKTATEMVAPPAANADDRVSSRAA